MKDIAVENTLPDSRGKGDARDLGEPGKRGDSGDNPCDGPRGRGPAQVRGRSRGGDCAPCAAVRALACTGQATLMPLACLAASVGLAAHVLAPWLAAAGLAGAGAGLAAWLASLFAVLLAVVSISIVAAIATMLLSHVARGTQCAVAAPSLRNSGRGRPSPRAAARCVGRVVAIILSVCGRKRPYARDGPLSDVAPPAAATLAPLSGDAHETA